MGLLSIKPISAGVLAIALVIIGNTAHAQLTQEPARGQLGPGEVVLVDDGTCGKGKIKQVTGGSDRVGGQKVAGSPRIRKCIARQ